MYHQYNFAMQLMPFMNCNKCMIYLTGLLKTANSSIITNNNKENLVVEIHTEVL